MYEVRIRIHEEKDLYNILDPDQVMLSYEIISYVNRKYREREHNDDYRLHVISDVPVDQDRVRKSFASYLDHEQKIESREHHICTLKQIKMVIIGIVFIGLWLMAEGMTDLIFVEILSVIGSFAMWEAANIRISEKPRIRIRRIRLLILSEADIIFSVAGEE